jgi:penicillin-binding protein-related factor A (putative recombinase)
MLGGAKFEGCFSAAGQCDFEGGFKGRHVCLEAKDCHEGAFPKSKIRDGQWKRLEAADRMGSISGLLLRFAGDTADKDQMWLVEFGALRGLFGKKASFQSALVTAENAHRLAYRAIGRGSIGLYGLETALLRIDDRLREDALRS